jgi:uncharacterized protein YdhG (YjbR/CyaY superfamily)
LSYRGICERSNYTYFSSFFEWSFGMLSSMAKENVTSYIAAAPKWAQGTLRELRKVVKAAAPKAEEKISYHIPYYNYEGRLAYFAVNKKHIGFYWISAKDKKTFAKDLASLKVVGNSLHIARGEKVPVGFIKRLVKSRVKSNISSKGAKSSKRSK